MKQLLLGSTVGHSALALREKAILLHSALCKPEAVGMIANDQIATLLITRMCEPGMQFVDVGAHIGSIITEVHRYDPSIEIVAVEAISAKAARLRMKFKYATIHGCAVGEQERWVPFFINLEKSGFSSLLEPADGGTPSREIMVPMKRLDTLVDPARVDAVKIDVEGAELGVLKGAEKLLSKGRPTIMFESGSAADSLLKTKEELWHYLRRSGYLVVLPARVAHNDRGLTLSGFLESHTYPRRTTNYFAIPAERREEIRDRARMILKIAQPMGEKPIGDVIQ